MPWIYIKAKPHLGQEALRLRESLHTDRLPPYPGRQGSHVPRGRVARVHQQDGSVVPDVPDGAPDALIHGPVRQRRKGQFFLCFKEF